MLPRKGSGAGAVECGMRRGAVQQHVCRQPGLRCCYDAMPLRVTAAFYVI